MSGSCIFIKFGDISLLFFVCCNWDDFTILSDNDCDGNTPVERAKSIGHDLIRNWNSPIATTRKGSRMFFEKMSWDPGGKLAYR